MKELLFNYFNGQSTVMSFDRILLNFFVSILLAIIIYISYRSSHSGPVYSARFNVSLIMLTLITTLVMAVIGNNVALSLGMVGALSIVRFRTAIKDPRDTAYIFWCIAVGICCGVSEYMIAAIGSTILFLLLLLLGRVQRNDRFLIIVRCARDADEAAADLIKLHFEGRAMLRVKNIEGDATELIYEVSQALLKKYQEKGEISGRLAEVEGVGGVNLVCQNDEINR